MSALTALISDAHRLRATPVSINPYAYCTCGQWDAADWDEAQEFLEHLIEVTEAAVREQIELDIAARWETFELPIPVSTATPDQVKFYRFGYLWASHTVRGVT